ncbi:MAG: hypothetical protein WBN40_01480 [Pseudomonadales bacterium]
MQNSSLGIFSSAAETRHAGACKASPQPQAISATVIFAAYTQTGDGGTLTLVQPTTGGCAGVVAGAMRIKACASNLLLLKIAAKRCATYTSACFSPVTDGYREAACKVSLPGKIICGAPSIF